MKIIELLNRVRIPITNEEADLMGKFSEGQVLAREDFSPRELHIANQLVNKDILLRRNQSGRISYQKKTPN